MSGVDGAGLTAVVGRAFDDEVIGMWGAANVILSAGRLAMVIVYKRRPRPPEDARLWANAFVAGSGLNRVLWGLTGVVFSVADVLSYPSFTVFLGGGPGSRSPPTAWRCLAAICASDRPARGP